MESYAIETHAWFTNSDEISLCGQREPLEPSRLAEHGLVIFVFALYTFSSQRAILSKRPIHLQVLAPRGPFWYHTPYPLSSLAAMPLDAVVACNISYSGMSMSLLKSSPMAFSLFFNQPSHSAAPPYPAHPASPARTGSPVHYASCPPPPDTVLTTPSHPRHPGKGPWPGACRSAEG